MDRKSGYSEGDLTSSEGSAHLIKYTEEDNISVTGSITEENIPAWHAIKASDSDDEIDNEDNRRNEEEEGTVSISSNRKNGCQEID